jgi:hypothetical protein
LVRALTSDRTDRVVNIGPRGLLPIGKKSKGLWPMVSYRPIAKRHMADRGMFYGCIAKGCVAKYLSR